jgi:MFS family permease
MRSLTASNVSMLLVASGMFSMFYFASLYVQEILGYGPLKAGFAFLPFTFGIVIGAGAAQTLIQRIGIRAVTTVGLIIATIGLGLFTQVTTHGSYWTEVFAGVAVMSIGMGLTFVPVTLLATTNVANEDAGLASGIFNTSQQIGGALGLAILSTLAASRTATLEARGIATPEALTRGYHVAFAVGAAFLAAGLVVLLVGVRKRDVESIDVDEPVLIEELAA